MKDEKNSYPLENELPALKMNEEFICRNCLKKFNKPAKIKRRETYKVMGEENPQTYDLPVSFACPHCYQTELIVVVEEGERVSGNIISPDDEEPSLDDIKTYVPPYNPKDGSTLKEIKAQDEKLKKIKEKFNRTQKE